MFRRIQRGLRFIAAATRMAFSDKDMLIPSFLSLLASLAWTLFMIGTGVVLYSEGLLPDEGGAKPFYWVWIFVFFFGEYFIAYFFSAATIRLVLAYLQGEDPQTGPAIEFAISRVPQIFALAFLSATVQILLNVVRGKKGESNFIRQAIAGVIEGMWTMATYLVMPIMIIEDLGVMESVARARKVYSQAWYEAIFGEVAVTTVSGFIAAVLTFGSIGAGAALFAVMSPMGFLAAALSAGLLVALTLAFVMTWNMYLHTTYYACLYLWAAKGIELGRAPAPAQAPAPLAGVLA